MKKRKKRRLKKIFKKTLIICIIILLILLGLYIYKKYPKETVNNKEIKNIEEKKKSQLV